jgi:hypothetical protein
VRALSVGELLAAWEQGIGQSPVQRALGLLTAAWPETPREELARLSLGRRDARLLALREQLFGPELVGLTACPACGERLEFRVPTADLRAADGGGPAEAQRISVDGYEVRFRLPNSADLLAVGDGGDPDEWSRRLLARCVEEARDSGEGRPVAELPAAVVAAVAQHMARVDPLGDVGLHLTCRLCRHGWSTSFDIVSFLWREIDAWAQRLLREVHALAGAYGWREADILALSQERRRVYLELVGA